MKHIANATNQQTNKSPPTRGARIETLVRRHTTGCRRSPPTRGARIETILLDHVPAEK